MIPLFNVPVRFNKKTRVKKNLPQIYRPESFRIAKLMVASVSVTVHRL